MTNKKRHLITAALPYANGPLHIGHLAGSYLPADIYARYLRLNNKDVAFICGSDEHGAAITLRAKKEGITPQEIVDKYHNSMKDTFEKFGVSFDIYHRTSSQLHHKTAQEMFLEMYKKGCFVEKTAAQYFDEEYQQFLADRYITGTCPKCKMPNAYGDQCEKCGSTLSPTELIDPTSVLSGKKPVLKITKHWYLPMGEHTNWVRAYIEEGTIDGKPQHNPKDWKNHVLGQCKSWLNDGLTDRAMTRDLDWGVKIPLPDTDGKVLYVWFDAPIGYISATKKWALENNKNWEEYWKNEDSELVHFIGKDNIVFHCIIFPIILKSHGGYILPTNVPANEFMNLEGDKISTSRNWAVWAHEYLEDFPNQQDLLRYVLCATMPENKDSEFTWKEFMDRVNNELVANLGNFVNRTFVLTHKYWNGHCPTEKEMGNLYIFEEQLQKYIHEITETTAQIGDAIQLYRFKDALSLILKISAAGNSLFSQTEPWKLYKTDPEKTSRIIYMALQICANLSILIEPFLPFSAKKLSEKLNIQNQDLAWTNTGYRDIIQKGKPIAEPFLLFEKITPEQVEAQLAKLQAKKAANSAAPTTSFAPLKPNCSFEDFTKIDLRTGKILAAQKVPKADKLLELEVDLGFEKRTIVSGIATHFSPEELIGKEVVVVANLAPRVLRGIESKGMILLVSNEGGKLGFIQAPIEFEAGLEIT